MLFRSVVTAEGDKLFDSWDHPTGKPFSVVPVKVAKRGEFLSAVVLFKTCQPDAAGNCNVEMDITAFDPKGRVYGTMPKEELWQGARAGSGLHATQSWLHGHCHRASRSFRQVSSRRGRA